MGSNFGGGPTRMACSCFTLPFSSPVNFVVSMRPIALAALFVRALACAVAAATAARACSGERSGGGMGMISNWCTDFGLLPVAGAQAIRAGVAAADDHDALAGGQNLVGHVVAGIALVLLRQELHGEVNALQFAPGNIQIARSFRAAGQQHGVKFLAQILRRARFRPRARASGSARPPPSSVRGAGRGRAFPA